MKQQVQSWLTDWFVTRGKVHTNVTSAVPADTLSKTDYFEAGWLTSMEVVELVTEIERQFAVQFSERDLQDPRFVTIAGLTELIIERSTESSESR